MPPQSAVFRQAVLASCSCTNGFLPPAVYVDRYMLLLMGHYKFLKRSFSFPCALSFIKDGNHLLLNKLSRTLSVGTLKMIHLEQKSRQGSLLKENSLLLVVLGT